MTILVELCQNATNFSTVTNVKSISYNSAFSALIFLFIWLSHALAVTTNIYDNYCYVKKF